MLNNSGCKSCRYNNFLFILSVVTILILVLPMGSLGSHGFNLKVPIIKDTRLQLISSRVPPIPDFIVGETTIRDMQEARLQSEVQHKPKNGKSAVGTKSIIGLLVQFQPDTTPTTTGNGTMHAAHGPAYFENILSNLRDYYHEVSYGKLALSTTVNPVIYTLPQDMAYYGTNTGDWYQHTYELVYDTIQASDDDVNFALYDSVFIFHAGAGEETDYSGNSPDDIWSEHAWFYTSPIPTNDGVSITSACILPETEDQDGVTGSSILGTVAHEYGHELGLPDLYDVDHSSAGIGVWGLMGAGCWLNFGATPSHPCAWAKIYLGWLDPILVTTDMIQGEIPNFEQNPITYKIPIGYIGTQEYFLVTNRERIGYDAELPGGGLLIWHIDDSVGTVAYNDVNMDDNHRRVDLEEADGDDDPTEHSDPWKYPKEFTATSIPSSIAYDGTDSEIAITDISAVGTVMSASIYTPIDDPELAIIGDTELFVDPGEEVMFILKVISNKDYEDTVALSMTGTNIEWAALSQSEVILENKGDYELINLTVRPPKLTYPNEEATLAIIATSADGSSASDQVTVKAIVTRVHGVTIKNEYELLYIDPDTTLTSTFMLINEGNGEDLIQLESEHDEHWTVVLAPTELTLDAFATANIEIRIGAPPIGPYGLANMSTTITITATAPDGSTALTNIKVILNQVYAVVLNITVERVCEILPGAELTLPFLVKNAGNGKDHVKLGLIINNTDGELITQNTTSWNVTLDLYYLNLSVNEELWVTLKVTAPPDALAYTRLNITIVARSEDGNVTGNLTINMIVRPVHGIQINVLEPELSVLLVEKMYAVFNIEVINLGNEPDTFIFEIGNLPENWSTTVTTTEVVLDAFATTTIKLTVTPNPGAIASTYEIMLKLSSTQDTAQVATTTVKLIVAQFHNVKISIPNKIVEIYAGEFIDIPLSVSNLGNGEDTIKLCITPFPLGTAYYRTELGEHIDTIMLAPYTTINLTLRITINPDVTSKSIETITLYGIMRDGNETEGVNLSVSVKPPPALDRESAQAPTSLWLILAISGSCTAGAIIAVILVMRMRRKKRLLREQYLKPQSQYSTPYGAGVEAPEYYERYYQYYQHPPYGGKMENGSTVTTPQKNTTLPPKDQTRVENY
jgi:M6 family metalloprotease-like protein